MKQQTYFYIFKIIINMRKIAIFPIFLLSLWGCGNSSNTKPLTVSDDLATTKSDSKNGLARGNEMADKAQQTLMSALTKAIAEQGAEKAIDFCSLHALPILDSIGGEYKISRISARNRNPNNAPKTPTDIKILQDYLEAARDKKELRPHLTETNEENIKVFYRPILLAMPTCLQCHGDKTKDISPAVAKAIAAKYPNDLATGFALGDLRGAWRIELLAK
jgi:hypothetical protein